MNIIDIIIIIFILLCMITGSNRGVIKETVNVVGTFLVLVFSFMFMGPLANILCKFLPFFNLGLLNINLAALNILVYHIVAFVIIFFFLNAILRMILVLTNIVDILINCLVFIKPISSFLGAIVGLLSGYVLTFMILLILTIPFSASKNFHSSMLTKIILEKTPILAPLTSGLVDATNDVYDLVGNINSDDNSLNNSNQYNLEALDIMLKYNLVSKEDVEDLYKDNKLGDIQNLESIFSKY